MNRAETPAMPSSEPVRLAELVSYGEGAVVSRTIKKAEVGTMTVFALPGIGRLLVDAIYTRDYLMVQGCILLITVGYLVINGVVDLVHILLDPRIRIEDSHGF